MYCCPFFDVDLELCNDNYRGLFSKLDFSSAAVFWLIAIVSELTIQFLPFAPRMLSFMRTNYTVAALMNDPIATQTIYQVTRKGHSRPSNYRTLSSRLFWYVRTLCVIVDFFFFRVFRSSSSQPCRFLRHLIAGRILTISLQAIAQETTLLLVNCPLECKLNG